MPRFRNPPHRRLSISIPMAVRWTQKSPAQDRDSGPGRDLLRHKALESSARVLAPDLVQVLAPDLGFVPFWVNRTGGPVSRFRSRKRCSRFSLPGHRFRKQTESHCHLKPQTLEVLLERQGLRSRVRPQCPEQRRGRPQCRGRRQCLVRCQQLPEPYQVQHPVQYRVLKSHLVHHREPILDFPQDRLLVRDQHRLQCRDQDLFHRAKVINNSWKIRIDDQELTSR